MAKRKKIKKQPNDFDYLKHDSFSYNFYSDIEYDMYRPCENGSDCCDDDYCRCGTIINVRVLDNVNRSVTIAKCSARIVALHNSFAFYCLERLISCVLRKHPDCLQPSISGGYYGEEMNGLYLTSETLTIINNFIDQLNKPQGTIASKKLVESILSYEYGYVLTEIEAKTWTYEKIPIGNIYPGNNGYQSTSANTIDQYKTRTNLTCLCKKVATDKFVLVDGYHRFAAAKGNKSKHMHVMWCEA